MNFSLFISCPKGLEYLLEEEVKTFGLQVTQVNPQGDYGEASLAVVYQLCIWSRLANRVQLILFSGHAFNEQTLYKLCHQFAWQTVFSADKTLAVEFHGSSPHIRNTMYGAQVVKDAIVDHFRKLQNKRPTVAKDKPQILVHAYLKQETLTVSFDLTGYSMHQRGYRTEAGIAPIKENVAAALLLRAQWPKLLQQGFALDDPFCGSGTLVIEAAMMAARVAPGLLRQDQSLCNWTMHQSTLWDKMRTQALKQVRPVSVKLSGTDNHDRMILAAKANAERAGVGRIVDFSVCKLADCRPKASQGLVIANPPYGERLSDATQLMPLYQQLGQVMHEHYQGWEMAVLTSNPMLAKAIGLRAHKQHYTVYNGALECKLYCFKLKDNRLKTGGDGQWQGQASMFANRLQKNVRHLQKWAKRHDVQCYRVYDHDLPEYAYAIDLYDNYAVLQESAPPQSVPRHKAEQRSLEVLQIVPQVLNMMPANLVIKQRKQQKGSNQYQKMSQTHQSIIVKEGQAKFYVNLYDYLDTGLFLDHRLLRLRFAKLTQGTRFLNCFCYTAAASVHAALAGALTTNVDLSKTYMHWAKRNFQLNELDLEKHQFQEDCIAWLKTCRERFGVIFLDPPSFSNSKRMQGTLDIQRDHEMLITSAARLLEDNGTLYFSTNLRKFKLSPYISSHFEVEDMTAETIDVDFKRNAKIHQCFAIRQKKVSA